MTTLAVSPSFPIPGISTSLTFTMTGLGSNFVRVWCTQAPDGSNLDRELKQFEAGSPRVQVYEGDGGATNPLGFIFDKGGTYTLVAQEYTKGSGFSGGYQDDPRGSPSETQVGTETSLTLEIGRRFTQTVGASPDTATLSFWLFGSTIQATTLAIHGEVTPGITNPVTPRAKTAALQSDVTTAVSALAGVTASTALGTISSIVSNFVTKFNAHIIVTTGTPATHAVADTDNTLKTELSAAPIPQTLSTFVTLALKSLRQHETNDKGSGIGSASTAYHNVGGAIADLVDQPLTKGVTDTSSAYAALGDIWNAFEAHRVNTSVHGTADTTNTLTSLPKIAEVHHQFFKALASASPATPPGDSSGAALLRNWGFKE